MTYLIALIIAIGLGAVIALLSFVNFGNSLYEKKSESNANQFLNIASSIGIAMYGYNIINQENAFQNVSSTDFNLNYTETVLRLIDSNMIYNEPENNYETAVLGMTENNNKTYLILNNLNALDCEILNQQATGNRVIGSNQASVQLALIDIESSLNKIFCYENGTNNYLAVYKIN